MVDQKKGFEKESFATTGTSTKDEKDKQVNNTNYGLQMTGFQNEDGSVPNHPSAVESKELLLGMDEEQIKKYEERKKKEAEENK